MSYEDWIIRYGVIVRKRFRKNQKLKYLGGLGREFTEMGYKAQLSTGKLGKENNYNLYVGDMDKAEYIIAAYYDTPPSTYGLFPYKLFSERNKTVAVFISSIIPVLLLMLAGGIFIVKVARTAWSDGSFGFMDILAALILIIIFSILYSARRGIAVQSNFVRNTSSIIAILSYASSLSQEDKRRIAFAFTDYGCVNSIGDKLLSEYKGKRSTVIHLDSVGNNKLLYIFYPSNKGRRLRMLLEQGGLKEVNLVPLGELSSKLRDYQEEEIYIASAELEGENYVVRNHKEIKNSLDIDNLDRAVQCLKGLTGTEEENNTYKKQMR